MRKGYFVIAILLAIALLAAGCASDPAPNGGEEGSTIYQDGTYVGYSDASHSGYGVATVTVEGDKIVAVELTEFRAYGEEKDWDTYAHEEAVRARIELADEFVEKNSTDVDTFTGATSSTEKYKQAVARALEKALIEPASDNTYFDGTFQGQTEANERGQRAIALVTIENDQIVDVVLEQTEDENNEFKDEDYAHEPFHEAKEVMAQRFVEANSPEVDTFTEATGSSTDWIAAVEVALEHAKR